MQRGRTDSYDFRFSRALLVPPMSNPPTGPSSWSRLLEDAQAYLEEGELEEALAVCEQAIDHEPEHPDGYLLAAEILLRMDDPESAAENVREALELDPDDRGAMALLGAALFESCDFDGARRALEPLLSEPGEHAEAAFLCAVIAERDGRSTEAQALYAEAARRDETYRTVAPLDRAAFDSVVDDTLEQLPRDIQSALENVSIQVEEFPSLEELRASTPPLSPLILGLFRGVPLAEKSVLDGGAPPDTVVLYQRCLELTSRSPEELMEEIAVTLIHEIGHYLGLSEEDLIARGVG
ncbi:MAG: metallopeptidase family protein [bacterium]